MWVKKATAKVDQAAVICFAFLARISFWICKSLFFSCMVSVNQMVVKMESLSAILLYNLYNKGLREVYGG